MPENISSHPVLSQPAPLDAAQILTSVGEVAYDWQIDTDTLSWSTNAAESC